MGRLETKKCGRNTSLPMNELLCRILGEHRLQWISHKINIWHSEQSKKITSWGPFWSYQLNRTANLAHLPRNQAEWAELAVFFSCYFQNSPLDFDFFNYHGCQTFILYEIHWYLSQRSLCLSKPPNKVDIITHS